MPDDIVSVTTALLDLPAWAAFDVDDHGRVLAGSDEQGSMQLVEIDPDGTRRPLTALPSRCTGRYVPGARRVVVMHDTGGDENWQLSMLDLDAGHGAPAGLDDLTPLVHDTRFMHVLSDVTAEVLAYHTNRRNGTDMDVVVRSLADGTERVVYDGGGYVGDLVLSHDASSVAIVSLSLQPASTHVQLVRPGADVAAVTDPHAHELTRSVSWTQHDDALIVASSHGREYSAIQRLALDGSAWEVLVADDNHELDCTVSRDGTAMLVTTLEDGVTALAVHEADGTRRVGVELPEDAVVSGAHWSPDGSHAVVTLSTPTTPSAVVLVDATTGSGTTLASAADAIADGLAARLATPTATRIPTDDGEQVPCFVFRSDAPLDAELAGASVLHIHGGPESLATRAFSAVVQALAITGFTVLVPNVRGSAGYGRRWVSLDDVDKRLDSVADLAALHRWLPSQGLDPARSALWGGSYGGYMVLAGLTMQPDLWAAGVDIVGISSLVTFLENTSSYRRAFREREYGALERDRDFLVRASPLTHLDAIQAPLFVIHGANDPRVPLSEAEQLVAAVREKGLACELMVFDDEGHGLAKRANRIAAYPPAITFLARQLRR